MVTGAADLILDGAFTANATGAQTATLGGTGTLITNGTSVVNGGQLHLDTRRWNNSGAMIIAGRLTLDNGAALTNESAGTLTLGGTNNAPIVHGIGAPAAVSNTGTLIKTSTAVQTIDTALDNHGIVNVSVGVLDLAANGTHTGTFTVNGAGTELAFVGGLMLAGAGFNGAGLVRVNGATVDATAPTAAANPFTLQAGVVTGSGDLTLDGPFTLSGGTVSGTGELITNGATTVNNATAQLDGRAWVISAR